MAASKGNCYLCGKESGKAAMKNHIIKFHAETSGQECRLLKIEGAYDKDYWLYVDIPASSALTTLDTFLRKIWLECCGHMSAFQDRYGEVGLSRKISAYQEGDRLLHEYDFGSTTETLITVLGTIYRKQQRGVRVLARNIPPEFKCRVCGKKADYVDAAGVYSSEEPFYCAECAGQDDELSEMLLPITNSPRMGVCGYCGELDTFSFVPPLEKRQ